MSHSNEKRQRLSEETFSGLANGTQTVARSDLTSAQRPILKEAKVVVGLDFGTCFSGFAYASIAKPGAEPDKVYTFYDWPSTAAAGAKPYCKTQTSVWYLPDSSGGYELEDWGWNAYVNHAKAVQASNSAKKYDLHEPLSSQADLFVGHFITNFKRQVLEASELIAGNFGSKSGHRCIARERLPPQLPVEILISDYLKEMSVFIMEELQKRLGRNIVKKDVQWCLTVPAIWTERAKQIMKQCLQTAGLVQGPYCRDNAASLHEEIIVAEPEAASVYCQQKFTEILRRGSRFLVVDAGGGTVDCVVHEKVDSFGLRVKEVTRSTGDFCGGTFVDEAFMSYLNKKIDGFQNFSKEYPSVVLTIKGYFESFKCSFDGKEENYDLNLPAKLSGAWEAHQKRNGSWTKHFSYCELLITGEDMKMIFDGQVDRILKLIADQLHQVQSPAIEAIMMVGGFSNSPYLMKRVRDRFGFSVAHILSPTDPGSAVCQGAVAFGVLGRDIMMSRKSRKTYGVDAIRKWSKGDPEKYKIYDDNGEALCQEWFCIFTRIGDEVPVNHSVSQEFFPLGKSAKQIAFTMYSTTAPNPAFVTDIGVSEVGSWAYPLPPEAQEMADKPEIEVTMYFGRFLIEVFAEPKNFIGEKRSMLSVEFEKGLLEDAA